VVRSWSLIGKSSASVKDIEVTEPRISRGESDQMKFEAEDIFLKVVFPSS